MNALVGAFNQEKALVGAFSVIVQPVVEPMEHYTALVTIFTGEWELNFPSERQLTRCRHTGCCWRCWSRCVMWQPGTVKVISVTSVTKVMIGGMGAETNQTLL